MSIQDDIGCTKSKNYWLTQVSTHSYKQRYIRYTSNVFEQVVNRKDKITVTVVKIVKSLTNTCLQLT